MTFDRCSAALGAVGRGAGPPGRDCGCCCSICMAPTCICHHGQRMSLAGPCLVWPRTTMSVEVCGCLLHTMQCLRYVFFICLIALVWWVTCTLAATRLSSPPLSSAPCCTPELSVLKALHFRCGGCQRHKFCPPQQTWVSGCHKAHNICHIISHVHYWITCVGRDSSLAVPLFPMARVTSLWSLIVMVHTIVQNVTFGRTVRHLVVLCVILHSSASAAAHRVALCVGVRHVVQVQEDVKVRCMRVSARW